MTALFGPSGCGKTTVLRCVAGLQRVADGYLAIDGEVWQDARTFRPVHRRAIGYVFQEPSLFAHLSVRSNLAYGLKRTRTTPVIGFDEVAALLGLGHLLDRAPAQLSGGERHRVAIGRALLSQPRLLLMDEPLSGLDTLAKQEILPYLERLHGSLSIPVLYVSHDIAEVERLADHLVLMASGRVQTEGPLMELQADPRLALARMRQTSVALAATVEAYDGEYGITTLAVDGGHLMVPGRFGQAGTTRRVLVAASDVSLSPQPPTDSSILNSLVCRIVEAERQDDLQMTVVLRLGLRGQGAGVLARITRKSWDRLNLGVGLQVYAQIKSVALIGAGAATDGPDARKTGQGTAPGPVRAGR